MPDQNMKQIALEVAVKKYLPDLILSTRDLQKLLPATAKDHKTMHVIEKATREIRTFHKLFHRDARQMDDLADESVHLVVTSPPYWTLKEHPHLDGQLGAVADYDAFLDQLDLIWQHCYRRLYQVGA